jgi:hypothetical protein
MDLIERLSAATGKDPELDTLIHEAIHGPLGKLERPQRYTASLDAAMTLIPEGYAFQVRRNVSPDGDEAYCNAQVWPYAAEWRTDEPKPHPFGNSDEKYPAIALTIAALRARQTTASST